MRENYLNKIMTDLDLDNNGAIDKDEFFEAFAMKHQALVLEKAELLEENVDLEMKLDMILDRELRQRSGYTSSNKGDITNIYKVTVVEARDLNAEDAMTGTSDPYAVLSYQGEACKTTVKKTNLNPIWKETFEFHKRPGASNDLEVTIYDEDMYMDDDIIGVWYVDLEQYPSNGKIYDEWRDIVDENKNKAGSVKLYVQHITHGIHAFEKEREVLNNLIEINDQKLENANLLLEMFEDNFQVFGMEDKEMEMVENIGNKTNKSKNPINRHMARISSKLQWVWWLTLSMWIYILLTVLWCLYRPCFWDVFNSWFMFYVVIQLFDSTVLSFTYLAFSLGASIVYDVIFLVIHIVSWWHGYTMEESDESGLRAYSIVMTIIMILYKIVETFLFMHTASSYGVLILPAKKALKTKYRMEMRMYQAKMKGRNLKDLYKSTRFPNDTPQYVDLIWDENNQGYDMTDIKTDKKVKKQRTDIDSINAPKTDRNSNPAKKKKTPSKV